MSIKLIAPAALVKEAASFDKQLRSVWAKMKSAIGVVRKSSIEFGEIVSKMQAKELHKYVENPTSRKGYISFEEYVDRITGGGISKNILYISKQMYALTQGPHAISAAIVADMPQENVRLLSSLKPEERTQEILKAVKSPNREFTKLVQSKKNESLPPEEQETPRIEFYREWHPDVVTKLETTMKRFHLLKGVVKDGDYTMTLDEKAILAICFAAEEQCSDLLTAAEASLKNAAMDIPQSQEASDSKSEAVEAKPAKKKLAKTKAKKAVEADDHASDGTRIKHSPGCRCLMCKPPKDSPSRAEASVQ